MKPELAVLGGSFDPPHCGHVLLAAYALSAGGVARVAVAPTFQHAFGKQLTAMEHRLRMCELAFTPLLGVEVTAIERELGGTSRTLRLVGALAARYPSYQLRLLIGSDLLHETPRWQQFDEICRLAPPLVAARADYEREELADAPVLPAISSSAIRQRLGAGADVSTWVPRAVRRYIDEHALYRASSP